MTRRELSILAPPPPHLKVERTHPIKQCLAVAAGAFSQASNVVLWRRDEEGNGFEAVNCRAAYSCKQLGAVIQGGVEKIFLLATDSRVRTGQSNLRHKRRK